MEFNQTVMARRSLRAYEEGKTVEKAQIEELIRFAQMAPSWKNSQTGRYYVVMSPEMLEKVRKDCLPEFNQKNSANAPALIITAFKKHVPVLQEKVWLKMKLAKAGAAMTWDCRMKTWC